MKNFQDGNAMQTVVKKMWNWFPAERPHAAPLSIQAEQEERTDSLSAPGNIAMVRRISLRCFPFALICLFLLMPAVSMTAQSTTFPEPVVASSTTTVGTGLNQPQGVGVDSAGNVFVASANSGSVFEFPVGGGASITVISGLSYNKGLAIDSFGNVFSTSYGGNISKWTAGAAANSGTSFVSGSTCPDFAAMGYYIGFYDLSADAHGNIYALGGNKYIMEFDQQGNCTERLTPTQLSAAPGVVASDAAGDLYYTIGSTIYYLPAGSTNPTALAIAGGSFASINALTVDPAGDLLVTDANSIDLIPMVNGALQTSTITYLLPAGASFNIGISPSGVLYYPNFNANSVVSTVIGSLALGASNVGTAGTAGVVTYTFNAAVTPTNFNFVSGSGVTTQFAAVAPSTASPTTCATGTAYAASNSGTISSCTLNVALTASTPGKITGAVQLQTASSTLATTYLSGTGLGAALSVDPGTQTTLGTFTTPSAVRIDGAGNVFVADSSANTVTEFPAGGGAAVSVGTGLNAPQGLAVDPAGNLFIADTGNNRIVEVPLVNGSLNTAGQAVVASGLSAPLGIALDLSGNLLIANSAGGTVLRLPNQGGVIGTLAPYAIGTGFKKPTAIAVDANNNIFIGDAMAANVIELTPSSQTSVIAGYSQISGLAVDANDDVFLTQSGLASVTRIALVSGAYSTNSTVALGVGLAGPQGIALDSAGNLYVADAGGGAAYKIQRTVGALNFGKVNVASTSASQSLSLSNFGNQGLTFGAPLYTTSGNTGDFAVAASANNGCATSLASGTSCGVSATFTPTASGGRTETLTFQDNAANAPSITATLSGTGASSLPTTLTLAASPSGAVNFGQTVTITATVAPTTASGSTPTGTVQFSVDGNNYGGPVGLGNNGTASEPITGLSGGAHTINATYSGDNTFASAAAATPLTITIATDPTSTSLTATISATTAVATGTSVTFTAKVTPNGLTPPPYPSGSVSFFAAGNTTPLGTSPLTNGVATFTTTALPNGQYNVVATYSGDADFAVSSSAGYAVYVSPPTFILASLPTTLAVPAQGSATVSFKVTPIAGYQGTVFFSCTGLPANSTCNFAPGGVDFAIAPGGQTVQLTVQTGIPPASFAGAFALPGLFALGVCLLFARKKGSARLLMLSLLLAGGAIVSMSLTGCSGSANFTSPTGSSTVTVHILGSAAPGGTPINQSFNFTVQVN